MANGSQDPVFDPDKCPVPFVQRIPQRDIIEDCDIPGPPDPIFDCPDASINIPPPVINPIVPCPQVETEVTVSGATFTVEVEKEDPCLLTFKYDLTVTGGGGDCPEITAEASIDCDTEECGVSVEVTKDAQQCAYEFDFAFSVPKGADGAQGSQGPQGPQGSKFAIIEVTDDQGDEQFLGLFCTEMPESYFMDIMDLKVQAYQTAVPMDRNFLKACEGNSFRVVSVVPTDPIQYGAFIDDDKVVLRTQEHAKCDRATVMVAGIRRHFAGQRFPVFSREQKAQNDRFWGSAFE